MSADPGHKPDVASLLLELARVQAENGSLRQKVKELQGKIDWMPRGSPHSALAPEVGSRSAFAREPTQDAAGLLDGTARPSGDCPLAGGGAVRSDQPSGVEVPKEAPSQRGEELANLRQALDSSEERLRAVEAEQRDGYVESEQLAAEVERWRGLALREEQAAQRDGCVESEQLAAEVERWRGLAVKEEQVASNAEERAKSAVAEAGRLSRGLATEAELRKAAAADAAKVREDADKLRLIRDAQKTWLDKKDEAVARLQARARSFESEAEFWREEHHAEMRRSPEAESSSSWFTGLDMGSWSLSGVASADPDQSKLEVAELAKEVHRWRAMHATEVKFNEAAAVEAVKFSAEVAHWRDMCERVSAAHGVPMEEAYEHSGLGSLGQRPPERAGHLQRRGSDPHAGLVLDKRVQMDRFASLPVPARDALAASAAARPEVPPLDLRRISKK